MLIIGKEDLDSSLNDIVRGFNLEERVLTTTDKEHLNQLKYELFSNISKTTDLEERKIHFNRINKINSILTIHEYHEYKLKQVLEYLKEPLTEIPEYSEKNLELEEINFRSIGIEQAFDLRNSLMSYKEEDFKASYDVYYDVPDSKRALYDNIDYFGRIILAIFEQSNESEVYEGMYRLNRLFENIDWIYFK